MVTLEVRKLGPHVCMVATPTMDKQHGRRSASRLLVRECNAIAIKSLHVPSLFFTRRTACSVNRCTYRGRPCEGPEHNAEQPSAETSGGFHIRGIWRSRRRRSEFVLGCDLAQISVVH